MAAWDKREDESGRSYEAFQSYRDYGKARSVDKAFQQQANSTKRAHRHWWDWYEQFDWKQRAEAYDAYLELEARKQREAEHLQGLAEYRDRQKRLAAATIEASIGLLQKAGARLKSLKADEIKPEVLPQFFRAAAAVAESATNSEANALAVGELMKALDGDPDSLPQ